MQTHIKLIGHFRICVFVQIVKCAKIPGYEDIFNSFGFIPAFVQDYG